MTHIRLWVKRPFVKSQHTLGMRISFSPSFRYTRSTAGGLVRQCSLLLLIVCLTVQPAWARIHESVITYDGHISRPDITELELGPSENSYSRARKRSVIVVLEVSGFHTGCLVTKRCITHGRRGLFVQLDNQVESDIVT